VYFAYADESGDSGYVNSPTDFFVLSCVLIHESDWQGTLDIIIDSRRTLKETYGIPVRAELKAEDLVYGRGPLRPLKMSRKRRGVLYRALLEMESRLSIRTFAVAIAKRRIEVRATNDPRELAWRYMIERLDTFCRKLDRPEMVMLFPDEGHGHLVRKIVRKARRFQMVTGRYGGRLDIRSKFLLEDPIDKTSSESYFTQLADWNVYAAHRYKDVAPNSRVPGDLWDALGETRLLEVNALSGGPPGIKVWP
jgi:hypothetical protein